MIYDVLVFIRYECEKLDRAFFEVNQKCRHFVCAENDNLTKMKQTLFIDRFFTVCVAVSNYIIEKATLLPCAGESEKLLLGSCGCVEQIP